MPDAAPRTRYAVRDGVHIAYQVAGDGPVDIVLSPGWVSNLDLQWRVHGFADFVGHLTQFARVIMFDKRGTGLSDPVGTGLPFEERTGDLTAVLDSAGATRPYLFGYSEGGPMAMLFAAAHPDRTSGLILYGTLAAGSAVPEQARAVLQDSIHRWGEGSAFPLFSPELPDTPAAREARGHYERASASPGMAQQLLDVVLGMDVTDALSSISVPTLVMHRDGDWLPIEHARRVAEQIPGAVFLPLQGRNHPPWQGDAAAVLAQIQGFVTGSKPQIKPKRRLATVMFTDIVGSTEHLARVGDSNWQSVLQTHHEIVRAQLAAFDGHEVNTTGDGFLAVFDGPGRAVGCGRAIVDAIGKANLRVRIGIHTGEVETDGQSVVGFAVHLAARIAATAVADQVLVSRTVADLLIGSDWRFDSIGEHALKGAPQRWNLLSVAS